MNTSEFVLAEYSRIEKQNENRAKQHAALDDLHDESMFKESLAEWQTHKTGAEPKRSYFVGAWQRLLAEMQNKANADLEAYEKEVIEGVKQITF